MLKIRALNRENSSDEDVPVIRREAQEEIALELYNKALHLIAKEDYSESESILLSLIDENIPALENNGGLPKSMSNFRYSCHRNLGNVYLKIKRVSDALDQFSLASDLDSTDVTLWFKIGNLSLKQDKFYKAANAFSKGLECSETHWPCLDKLITLLFAIRDTVSCLDYIGKALMLDPDYTKGLVLRKQIYKNSPSTRDYYELYNPDYIWEPPLDVPIKEEEEEKYLQEATALHDHVNEIEKSYGPKPLQTIPLPKSLAEYTWLALADTVIYLHQYLTENGMSHFTFIDMDRCMSENTESQIFKEPQEEKEVEPKVNEEKTGENQEEMVITEVSGTTDEKMDVDLPPERRPSQNSETNNDGQDTPVQTDIDEEQNMDQDTEQEDNTESKERSRPRGSKRKRDLLSDLRTWGWYSRRKLSKKAKDKDFTVEDALDRIVPKNLLPHRIDPEKFNNFEDSMSTMDLYNLYVENDNNYLSPIHSPKSVNFEPYFGTERESDDVKQLWTRPRDHCNAIVLVKDLVFGLSKIWHHKWPKDLIPLYISAYEMLREHCDQPQVFCTEAPFPAIRDDALATILYAELLTFSMDTEKTVHPTSVGYLQLVSGRHEDWQLEFSMFFNRVYWLRSHLFRKELSNDLAARALELIQEVVDEEEDARKERYMLSLPNCSKYGLISRDIIERILGHLDLVNSLANVEALFNDEKFEEVAAIIESTFRSGGTRLQVGRMGRPAQLGLLIHSLWFTDLPRCFVWTEECLHESFEQYLRFGKDHDKWEAVVEKCLIVLHEIIKSETVAVIDRLEEAKRARLVDTLARMVSKQLNSEVPGIPLNSISPWILLHYVLEREEHKQYAIKRRSQGKRHRMEDNQKENLEENELPASIAILFSAHEFLGAKNWCMTHNGELLHFILDTVLDRIDTPVFDKLRNKIDVHIEQAMFCLYQHPSKKNKVSRHLADHNVDPLPLTWERSFQLFEFYGPDCLPEFNSYKNASVSADLEQLLKRIIALVPTTCAPQQHLQKVMDYIHGKTEVFPDPIEFPDKVRSIYYLIGDFYFKQREFSKCIKYFQMDLCINPLRLDSWACLGLSYAALLDAKLNHCEKFKSEMEFLDKARHASICFTKALEICAEPLMLLIECGTFQYTVHSYCSRVLKFESENLSMEKFEYLENQKNTYLDSSGSSFEKAIAIYETEEESNDADERWLQYYILGKIAEKKQKEPTEYLQYYMTAITLLDENKAEYPEKINYSNPQHLAVEALELHYRINASVLKYLELHEGKEIPNSIGSFFKKCLSSSKFMKKSPLPKPEDQLKASESNSTSFQEQFLNSLNKSNEDAEKKIDTKVEEKVSDLNDDKKITAPETDDGDVIMISDSDDEEKTITPSTKEAVESSIECDTSEVKEKDKSVEDEEAVTRSEMGNHVDKTTATVVENIGDEGICEKNAAEKVEQDSGTIENSSVQRKDVQEMFDAMMEKTMKETEDQRMEVDSDLSGAERVEIVVVKEVKSDDVIDIVKKDECEKMDKPKSNDVDPHAENVRTSVEEDSSSSSSSSSGSDSSDSSEDDDDDDSSSNSSSSSSETSNEFMSQVEISQMIDKCILGLEICITRLAQNYKALYRLAHLYFNYKSKKDLTKCKQLLMNEYTCRNGVVVNGLFNDRKPTNFFNGIWRIPSTEIDRPGSLSAHMSRCISLLLQILRTTNDNKTLTDLSLQLRKTPEPDKIYIKDSERMAFSEQALTMCSQSLRGQMKNVGTMTNQQTIKLLQDIFKMYQRMQKQFGLKENQFAGMLVEVYRKYIKEKISDNVNVLELATKFCLQNKQAEKQKMQQQKNIVLNPRGAGILNNSPVLPTPSTQVSPLLGAATARRSLTSRPRGRPPLPKTQGQPRSRSLAAGLPKPSTSSPSFNPWQNPLFDYLKHYQDELIKQYSQNLSIAQLGQLSQMLTQGQINNPLTASAITNQFLAQSGLLGSPVLGGKQMGSAGGSVPQNSAAQFMETLNQLSPSVKKKSGMEQPSPSSSTAGTSKVPAIPTKVVSQHTVTTPSGIIQSKPKSNVSISKVAASAHKYPTPTKSDSLKGKSGGGDATVKNIPSNPGVFKEPIVAKVVPTDDKTAKDLMKDRPNISITPVSASLPPPPSFMRPPATTSPSSGKTLQEKLADKKKEQLNKLKASMASEHRSINPNIPTLPKNPIIPKHPNIPRKLNLPPSFQLTPAHVPIPKPKKTVVPKFPPELTLPPGIVATPAQPKMPTLPPSISVSKSNAAMSTPKFPPESGVSISQVRMKQPTQKKEKHRQKDHNKNLIGLSLGPEVDISKVGKDKALAPASESKHSGKSSNKVVSGHKKSKFGTKDGVELIAKDRTKIRVEHKKLGGAQKESDDDVICID